MKVLYTKTLSDGAHFTAECSTVEQASMVNQIIHTLLSPADDAVEALRDVPPVPIAQAIEEAKAVPRAARAITKADVETALRAYVARPGVGVTQAVKVLETFGVEKVAQLPADQYASFIKAVS